MRAHLAAIGCNGQEISRAHLAAIGCNGLIVILLPPVPLPPPHLPDGHRPIHLPWDKTYAFVPIRQTLYEELHILARILLFEHLGGVV